MQFLSIAWRELRVAARNPSCFRTRMFAAVIALLVAGFKLWLVTFFGSRPISGEALFHALSWVSLLCACVAGPALTADSVNEERNNGTLGFLFLTNLHSISITLGKLAGHGILAVYAIVSIMPVMALPAILGGADAESIARTALVLLVTLSLSLSMGMLASTVCRRAWVAATVTLLGLAILMLGIPVAATLLRLNQHAQWTWFEALSPSYALSMAGPSAVGLPSNRLWIAVSAQALVAFGFFGLTTFLLPRTWKEGGAKGRLHRLYAAWNAWKHGSGNVRRKLRERLLDINPILWLSCRERWAPAGHALILIPVVGAICWIGRNLRTGFNASDFLDPMRAWIAAMPLLYIGFCFRLAAAASERFAVDRKAGALELIMCTPLSVREILRGHWLGLLRRFWGAAVALLAIHAFTLNYIVEATRLEGLQGFNLREVVVKSAQHLLGVGFIPNELAPYYIGSLAVLTTAVLMVALWIALVWIGIALSLKLRRQLFAPWIAMIVLAAPPIPVMIGMIALLDNKHRFETNLFLGLFLFGAAGFCVVLTNAMVWLFIARRWTYRKLRAMGASA